MELGLTIPLQRFLRMKPPAFGTEPDRRFCWDLHVIDLRGTKSLLAVHCHSRYTFVLFAVSQPQWQNTVDLFREGLRESLLCVGFSAGEIHDFLCQSGPATLTRTHGRREVAFLNRAWEDVIAADLCLDPTTQCQPFLNHIINTRPCRCAGSADIGTGLYRMGDCLKNHG